MKRFVMAGLAVVAATGIAACSQNAQNESAEAGNAMAADTEATTDNAVNDVDAATDQALGSAEAGLDNAGDAIARGADDAADATGNALVDAGNAVRD